MKTTIERAEVSRSGVAEGQAFSIKASAKAFKILSDGLYSDKILAIIRELSSNAFDAHVEAGTGDKPFLVHLPNNLESWFSIRDYGTGLSHDNVMNLYTTYFDSTKNDSNDFTGALGLGSKSPFSYTETFTVTSYFNGEMRTYVADLGEEGVPQISLLNGFPMATKEPNGLEVKFAVKREDFSSFMSKAKNIYKRYTPLPEVVGVESFKLEPIVYALEGNGWRVIEKDDDSHYNDKSYAVQGTVAYPIDLHAMRGNNGNLLYNLNIEMDFPIGELDIAANRETLSYDESTCANIIKRTKAALVEIEAEINKKFDECKTLWDARLLYNQLFGNRYGSQSGLKSLVHGNKVQVKWKGEPFDDDSVRIDMHEKLSLAGFNVQKDRRGYRNDRMKHCRYAIGIKRDYLNLTVSEKVVFFVDDMEKGGAISRVKYFVEEGDGGKIEVYLIRNTTKKSLTDLCKLLGEPTIRKVSDLPKAPKSNRGSPSNARGNGYIWIGERASPSHEWNNSSVDFKAGGLYVPIHQLKPLNKDGGEISRFGKVINAAHRAGFINTTTTSIYGIPKGQLGKLKDKWINVFDFIKAETTRKVNDPKLLAKVADRESLQKFTDAIRRSHNVVENIKSVAKLVSNQSGNIVTLASHLKDVSGANVDESLMYLTRYFSINIKSSKKVDLVALWKKVNADYPMLEWPFDKWGNFTKSEREKTAEYIDLVDSQKIVSRKKVVDDSKAA